MRIARNVKAILSQRLVAASDGSGRVPAAEVLTSSALSTGTRSYYIKNTGMGGSFGFSTLVGALVGGLVARIFLERHTPSGHGRAEIVVRRHVVFLSVSGAASSTTSEATGCSRSWSRATRSAPANSAPPSRRTK